jgi:adhesin/invasin
LLLAPGGVTQPNTAFAVFDCNEEHQLNVEIRDLDNGNNPVAMDGIVVRISPDPQDADGGGERNYVDNGNNDDSNSVGRIRENEACEANAGSLYTATLASFPDDFECDIVQGQQTFSLESDNVGDPVELFVENCETGATATPTGTLTVTVTPTGTVTGTPGVAATVTTSASPGSIGCTGTSIVSISVRDADGDPLPPGTAVTITTTLGSVSPSSGQTTDASGNAFLFLTGEGQGGTATITAKSGNAQGSTTVTINCGAAATATSAPPPTVAPGGGGVISPPNTGDAGLAEAGTQGWMAFAGVAFLLAATIGAVGIVRARA